MKYVCLVYGEEKLMREQDDRDCAAFAGSIDESGHLVIGQALQGVDTATTVRVRAGKATVVDGPFAETKEQLAGFYLIDAGDLDEAIAIATRIPPARIGSIEIRPARELDLS
jgi:hypothetical protein